MSLTRKQVGDAERYHGAKLTAHYLGPDLLCCVDGTELSGTFYTNVEAALAAGRRYVDAQIKEEKKST